MFIKPATGIKLRDPVLKDFLPVEGREVESSGYWDRRLRDGDAVMGEAEKPKVASRAVPAASAEKKQGSES